MHCDIFQYCSLLLIILLLRHFAIENEVLRLDFYFQSILITFSMGYNISTKNIVCEQLLQF